jgi:RNA polymerase sigma factor for flagellar operon FliA
MTDVRIAPDRTTPVHNEQELVREYLPLVGHIVNQVSSRVPSHVNRDELTSAGLLALLMSVRSFDPDRGVPFASFAALRIRGAITDELRSMDWASRAVRTKARAIDNARNDLTAVLGRTPTRDELAATLGCSVASLEAADADVERASLKSLQELDPEDDRAIPASSQYAPESLLLQRERIGLLRDGIAELPPRLREVVERYFFQQHLMADIAADLGVTESRVSQLRAEALVYLREAMRESGEDGIAKPARRRTAAQARYAAAVVNRSSLENGLAATTLLAEPRPMAFSGTA